MCARSCGCHHHCHCLHHYYCGCCGCYVPYYHVCPPPRPVQPFIITTTTTTSVQRPQVHSGISAAINKLGG